MHMSEEYMLYIFVWFNYLADLLRIIQQPDAVQAGQGIPILNGGWCMNRYTDRSCDASSWDWSHFLRFPQ
jgi:hypothetical protein